MSKPKASASGGGWWTKKAQVRSADADFKHLHKSTVNFTTASEQQVCQQKKKKIHLTSQMCVSMFGEHVIALAESHITHRASHAQYIDFLLCLCCDCNSWLQTNFPKKRTRLESSALHPRAKESTLINMTIFPCTHLERTVQNASNHLRR